MVRAMRYSHDTGFGNRLSGIMAINLCFFWCGGSFRDEQSQKLSR
jgi:hypothetical protein